MSQIQIKLFFSSRRRAILLGFITLLPIAYIDWITGPHVSVTIFYLLPLCILTWFLGKSAGYLVSSVYTLIWLAIDIYNGEITHTPILIGWNCFVRFGTMMVVTYIVGVCKNLSVEIETLIEARTNALRAELETRRKAEEAIHRLANQLSAAEDAERRRIAQEIHDTMGQQLTLLKLQMQTLNPQNNHQPNTALETLDRMIKQTRTLLFELHPSMLQDLGLYATLEQYTKEVSNQTGISIQVNESGTSGKLPIELSSFVFRATKELMNNALKHGTTQEIVVSIRWQHKVLRIVVDNDGPGFDIQKTLSNMEGIHLGLVWIQERVHSLQGQFQMESDPNREGTRVIIDLPLPEPTQTRQEDAL